LIAGEVLMYYSTYRLVIILLYIVLEGAISALAFSYSAMVGVAFVLAFTLIGIIALWMNFHFTKVKLDENHGRYPMRFPVGFITGLEIIDETYSGPSKPKHPEGTAGNNSFIHGSHPSLVQCPFCHATVANPESRFCSDCGKAL